MGDKKKEYTRQGSTDAEIVILEADGGCQN